MTIPENTDKTPIPGEPTLSRYERSVILTRLNPQSPDDRSIGRKLATTTDWLTVFEEPHGKDQNTPGS